MNAWLSSPTVEVVSVHFLSTLRSWFVPSSSLQPDSSCSLCISTEHRISIKLAQSLSSISKCILWHLSEQVFSFVSTFFSPSPAWLQAYPVFMQMERD